MGYSPTQWDWGKQRGWGSTEKTGKPGCGHVTLREGLSGEMVAKTRELAGQQEAIQETLLGRGFSAEGTAYVRAPKPLKELPGV